MSQGRTTPGASERTTVRRKPDRAVLEAARVHAILDAGLVAHLAVVEDGQPFVLPVAYARMGDKVVFHGSSGSRLMRALADGSPCCLTVTLLDALVVAATGFDSSMNYRSVMVLGRARQLDGDEGLAALRAITEHLTPGRWDLSPEPSPKERAATLVLELSLDDCSAKTRTGGPAAPEPARPGLWCGVVPIHEQFGAPETAPFSDVDVPAEVLAWTR